MAALSYVGMRLILLRTLGTDATQGSSHTTFMGKVTLSENRDLIYPIETVVIRGGQVVPTR